MSVHPCTAPAPSDRKRLARGAIQRGHGAHGAVDDVRGRATELERGRDDSRAERLRQDQHVARTGARVRPDLRRRDEAGHGISELDLAVLDGVAAEQGDSRFDQLVEPALEDRAQHLAVGFLRERRDRERRERTSAHRVDVAQRVRRRDLAVHERIVDDGREEIDGLHERAVALERVHTRIVGGPIVDQDPWVVRHVQIAQDLGELTSRELARSTSAGGVVGQAFSHSDRCGFGLWALARARKIPSQSRD